MQTINVCARARSLARITFVVDGRITYVEIYHFDSFIIFCILHICVFVFVDWTVDSWLCSTQIERMSSLSLCFHPLTLIHSIGTELPSPITLIFFFPSVSRSPSLALSPSLQPPCNQNRLCWSRSVRPYHHVSALSTWKCTKYGNKMMIRYGFVFHTYVCACCECVYERTLV